MITIKAFEELGLKHKKFAGLVFGVLIVEDLVAILLLVLFSTLAVSQQSAGTEMLYSILKLAFFPGTLVLGRNIPGSFISKSNQEINERRNHVGGIVSLMFGNGITGRQGGLLSCPWVHLLWALFWQKPHRQKESNI
jgi:Kef-type K+ transport system membrane component KefB